MPAAQNSRRPLSVRRDSLLVPRAHRVAVVMAMAAQSGSSVCSAVEWSQATGAGASTIAMWCRAAGVRPKDAIRFTRALCALSSAAAGQGDPHDLLNFADQKSLRKFLAQSGPLMADGQLVTAPAYCRQQQFIRHSRIVADVQRLLTSSAS